APAPTVEAALPAAPPPPAELPPPVYDVAPVPVADPPPDAPALIPVDGTAPEGPVAANGVPLPPGVTDPAPGLVPAEVTPVPERSGGFLGRIRDRLSDIGKPDEPAQAPVAGVPPQDPLLVPPPADAPAPPPPG